MLLIYTVNLCHVSFPVVLSGKPLATLSRVIATSHDAVKLLLLLMAVIDVSLEMSLGSKALSAILVWAFMILGVISLVMSRVR